MVHSVRFNIRVPTVVVLRFFDRLPSKEVKFTRQNIYERDNHTCQYCARSLDRQELNLDHVMPRQRGGETSWEKWYVLASPATRGKGTACPTKPRCSYSSNRSVPAGVPSFTSPTRPRFTIAGAISSMSVAGAWNWGIKQGDLSKAFRQW